MQSPNDDVQPPKDDDYLPSKPCKTTYVTACNKHRLLRPYRVPRKENVISVKVRKVNVTVKV